MGDQGRRIKRGADLKPDAQLYMGLSRSDLIEMVQKLKIQLAEAQSAMGDKPRQLFCSICGMSVAACGCWRRHALRRIAGQVRTLHNALQLIAWHAHHPRNVWARRNDG